MLRRPRPPGESLLSRFFVWRVVMVSVLMMVGSLGLFLWELDRGAPVEVARTLAVDAIVVAEMFYLLNSRRIRDTVLTRDGLFGNRYVLAAIAACAALQLLFTYAPFMQAIFGSAAISWADWGKVLAAGLLVFVVAEFEKWVVRRLRPAPVS